jgi:xylulose-5-phosphate/fructose-6-phosphate phosphoketolase
MICVVGPGHGGPGIVAHVYLEGTYSEVYPHVSQDEAGMQRLFKQFSFPGGIPSHVAPETPGSIHEGGELGYSLAHAHGAAFDNPDLIVACIVGDGEAETGPLAASWASSKFLNPARDGAVLPILHLNGAKIAGPTVLSRIPRSELDAYFTGMGYEAVFVEGDRPAAMHRKMADALDQVIRRIRRIQGTARRRNSARRPRWPMIVLRTPKGWTGPKRLKGKPVEGTFRSHQVPLADVGRDPAQLRMLERWMRSYRPEELFDARGRLDPELAELAPRGARRMSDNPHTNGGLLLQDLRLPDFRSYAVKVPAPGAVDAEATRIQGELVRDTLKLNADRRNFRLFSPDETTSNRWDAVFEVTDRCSTATVVRGDEHLSPDGRVMEILSEHLCQGWLEGYLLTGRHGFFSCYEAFVHLVDSMFNQHAKWLKVTRQIPWRKPIASLNYLLTSHVWRQDHNGFSHQDPGFIDHVVNKKAEIIRIYLPPDANTLLSITDHCLRSRHFVNVIVAGKQPAPQWLDMEAAIRHCAAGIGVWDWASSDGGDPDVVLACAGDVPTLETLAAASLLRGHLPELRVRVVNVVDLMTLQPPGEHPHGLTDDAFDRLFTKDKPIIFAFHGYPWLIHRLTYRRTNHRNLHVRGYKEEGTTTTPFDMAVLNDIDRFHLVDDVIERVPGLRATAGHVRKAIAGKLAEHRRYIVEHGDDLPEIRAWRWGVPATLEPGVP